MAASDAAQLVSDVGVVRLGGVLQRLEVVEDVFDFMEVFSGNPQLFLGVLEAVGLDLLDLVHGVLLLLPPLEFLLEEVQDDEVQTPQVISS